MRKVWLIIRLTQWSRSKDGPEGVQLYLNRLMDLSGFRQSINARILDRRLNRDRLNQSDLRFYGRNYRCSCFGFITTFKSVRITIIILL